MNVVSKDVEKLVEKELASANERFPQFHSPHEGWAVICEEVEELRQETDDVEEALNILWGRVRYNMRNNPCFAIKIKERAVAAACEAIQVAAMAQKYLDMHGEEEQDE